jgi:hypothetical protein
MTMPMTVKVASAGRAKIAVNNASRRDCQQMEPKWALAGRSRQSDEFTEPTVSGTACIRYYLYGVRCNARRSEDGSGLHVRQTPRDRTGGAQIADFTMLASRFHVVGGCDGV